MNSFWQILAFVVVTETKKYKSCLQWNVEKQENIYKFSTNGMIVQKIQIHKKYVKNNFLV